MHDRSWLKYVLVAALVLSFPLAAHASRPDAWITMKAKTALYSAEDVSGTAINVDTINGRVTLHGKVHSDTEKNKAAEVVRKVEGVVDVRNLLQVVPASKEVRVQRADDRIKKDVEKGLKADRSLDDSSISVKSVNKGVVLLSGKAASANDYVHAVHFAADQPGVVHVSSEIAVPDTLADEDFKTNVDTKTAAGKRNPGGVMSDMWITSATKMKLAADSRTPATEINVDTTSGVVTLFGMVPSEDSKAAAAEIARGVHGVKRVDNEIEVVSSARQEMVQSRDEDIQAGVKKALTDRGDQENANIGVEVKNGVVRLTGTVPSWQRGLSAVYSARSVAGVRSVLNDMNVTEMTAGR
jgi:hyperosmotically inducible periplasmic protein